jgi:hypothetical protein
MFVIYRSTPHVFVLLHKKIKMNLEAAPLFITFCMNAAFTTVTADLVSDFLTLDFAALQ